MTILANDIKLVASRVMDDVPEGGGAPTSTVIVDGASNAMFPDISELDRAGGDVSFRKIHIHVQTDNTDTYLGSNVIVALPPSDPNVSVTLFSTNSTFDEREDASARVESYLVAGPEWPGYLLENHVAGQRAIQIFQRPEAKLPDIGETIIVVYHEGLSDERLQYIRVISVASALSEYVTPQGRVYKAVVATIGLSDPLRADYPGSPPSEFFQRTGAGSKVRESTVGDAAVYSGVSPLAVAVDIGDISANVESIFTQLVPSAQTEIPLVDQDAAGQSAAIARASDGTVSYTTSQPFNSITSLSLGNPVTPGTLAISIGARTLTDVGGQVFDGATAVGAIDYGIGVITFPTLSSPYTGSKTVTFSPAASPARTSDTAQIPVTQESRAFNYVLTIFPPPNPGSVQASYRAQGRWYSLFDNAGGALHGTDASFGVGSINYATGSVSITLGALPDDSSSILFSWNTKANYIDRTAMPVDSPSVHMQLPSPKIEPNSITVTWNDGTARTASDDGKGIIAGSATGTVNYATGVIEMTPTNLPAGGQSYQVAYDLADPDADKSYSGVPLREVDTTMSVNLGSTAITPGTLHLSWPIALAVPNGSGYVADRYVPATVSAKDDGDGHIVTDAGRAAGTINYATGQISFQPDGSVTGSYTVFHYGGAPGYGDTASFRAEGVTYLALDTVMPFGATLSATFQAGGTPVVQTPATFTAPVLKFDLTTRYGEQIVPGSVNFSLGSRRYFDKLGTLFNNLDIVTGAATAAGTINYSTGEIVLTDWVPGAAATVTVASLLTVTGDQTVTGVTFRVPVSPVRPGSIQILAAKTDGGTYNVTANIDGSISGTGIRGTVNYETGVVSVEFGALVNAAANVTAPWYDASLVVGGNIWKPAYVFAETLRFNAVAFSYLPLDAGILGLDPVRLPQDGRVPIFRAGSFAVIGHTKTSAPATVVNAQVVDLARVRLSRVRVVGNDGLTIPDGYTVDLEAGLVTFNDVTGYSQPVTIEDRIEDMAQVSDVQINGMLTFTRQITHHYPLGSYVSSALVSNDLKARVSKFFDQTTWDGATWSDSVIGSAAVGTYNNTLAPIEVTNRGAISERWALRFTSSTQFQIIGEHVGVIDLGTINTDCAPTNPATGQPYFTIREAGWGIGWVSGNVIRLNTVGAQFPVWVVRTVQQGAESVQDDVFTILTRGDVNRP